LEKYSVFEEKPPATFDLSILGLAGSYQVTKWTLDRTHGSAFDAWVDYGAPSEPTQEAIVWLKRKSGPDLMFKVSEGQEDYKSSKSVRPHGVTLIEIQILVLNEGEIL
jgi:xylan 1,4-beta-xylosidase